MRKPMPMGEYRGVVCVNGGDHHVCRKMGSGNCGGEAPHRDDVEACLRFLREEPSIERSTTPLCTSYLWKHRVEDWYRAAGIDRHVTNGAFVQACKDEGIKLGKPALTPLVALRRRATSVGLWVKPPRAA